MKGKKLLSTAVAGALVAAQMVMPVMAADTGSVQVPVTTKTAVIRVKVPTKLVIAVDQFEMETPGTQIHSDAFTMENLSEVDVKVSVVSTATLGANTTLVGTKEDAEDSTEEGEAWIAIAAQSAAGDYDDPKTDTSDATANPAVADTPETVATLTEANSNVAVFEQGTGAASATATASQDFYLKKGTAPVGYTLLNKNEDATEISYAQFYELTEVPAATFTGTGDSATLQGLVDAGDVYHVATPGDGATLTQIKKGTANVTYTSGDTYYTVATTVTAKTNLDTANKYYVYGGTATPATINTTAGQPDESGQAAFRYIGKLSEEQETWSESDISQVDIAYTIVGVTQTRYDDVKDDCTYGLYYDGESAATVTEVNGVRVTNGSGATTYSTGADVANRLKSGAVQFVLDSSTATAVKTGSIAVTKIEIDGTEYTPTGAPNSSANADSDGKTYSVTGFTASSVTTIKVFYGTDLVVKYTF